MQLENVNTATLWEDCRMILNHGVRHVLPRDWPHPIGAYLCIGHSLENGEFRPFLHVSIGDQMNAARTEKTYLLSLEKAQRLARHPEHNNSGESADFEKNQYPGAIRYSNGMIGSISGFPAAVDEATSALIGFRMQYVEEPTIWNHLGGDARDYYTKMIKTTRFRSTVVDDS